MAADDPKFTCTGCGKEYRWKPELAGRKAKCACGATLVVPTERPGNGASPAAQPPSVSVHAPAAAVAPPPVPPAKPAEAKPSVAASAAPSAASTCPSCGGSLAPGAVFCVNCGYNLKTGKTLTAAVVVERDEEDDAVEPAAAAASAKPAPPAKPAKPAS